MAEEIVLARLGFHKMVHKIDENLRKNFIQSISVIVPCLVLIAMYYYKFPAVYFWISSFFCLITIISTFCRIDLNDHIDTKNHSNSFLKSLNIFLDNIQLQIEKDNTGEGLNNFFGISFFLLFLFTFLVTLPCFCSLLMSIAFFQSHWAPYYFEMHFAPGHYLLVIYSSLVYFSIPLLMICRDHYKKRVIEWGSLIIAIPGILQLINISIGFIC